MTDVYVMGDLHGHYDAYVRVLTSAGLIDDSGRWSGGDAHLWQIGDFFDRGNQGAECVALTMRLQQEASDAGGMVNALLGNHELMLLCAARFGDAPTRSGLPVRSLWHRWGGVDRDLEQLGEEQLRWIGELPLIALVGDHLLLHADSTHYIEHGLSIDAVNTSFAELIASDELPLWEGALVPFCEHEAFSRLPVSGKRKAEMVLRCYGGSILVHGHTPVALATKTAADQVVEPWVYADGVCVNIDGGLYLGGTGFLYRFTA